MDGYLGEIRIFAGQGLPSGWMFCRGQELVIKENESLFQLIGTRYGGDGETTFQLPDLQARIPVGIGSGKGLKAVDLGEKGGRTAVTLGAANLPLHNHTATMQGSLSPATSSEPITGLSMLALAKAYTSSGEDASGLMYTSVLSNPVTMNTRGAVLADSDTGTSNPAPHNNMQPYIVMNYIICIAGQYPQPDESPAKGEK